jgi:hypothetical protein
VSAFFLAAGVLAAFVRTFGLALAALAGILLLAALLALRLAIHSDVLNVAAAVVFFALVVVRYALDSSISRNWSWRGRSDDRLGRPV